MLLYRAGTQTTWSLLKMLRMIEDRLYILRVYIVMLNALEMGEKRSNGCRFWSKVWRCMDGGIRVEAFVWGLCLSMGEVTNVLTDVVWSELNQRWVKGGGMEAPKLEGWRVWKTNWCGGHCMMANYKGSRKNVVKLGGTAVGDWDRKDSIVWVEMREYARTVEVVRWVMLYT